MEGTVSQSYQNLSAISPFDFGTPSTVFVPAGLVVFLWLGTMQVHLLEPRVHKGSISLP